MQQTKPSGNKLTKLSPRRLLAFVSERVSRFGHKCAPLFAELFASVAKAAKRTGIDISRYKEYFGLTLYGLFGFFMSFAALSQGIRPFGIAALCSMRERKQVFFTYVGCAIACVSYGGSALSSFIIYFMLYAARKAFTESSFSEPLYVRILESAATAMAVGVIRICAGGESPLYGYVAFLALTATAAAFTYFFTTLFDANRLASAKLSTRSICSYALVAAFVCSLSGLTLFGFDIQLACACLVTLTYAVANGFMHAGIIGFVCGLACGSPMVSAALGVSGILAALVFHKSVFASLFAFAAAFTVCGAYGADLGYAVKAVPSVVCACVLFFPTCGFLPDMLRLNECVQARKKSALVPEKSAAGAALSEAFFSLSDMFSKLAEKQKYPSLSDVDLAVEKTFSEVCAGCALSEMCYARSKTDRAELKETLFSVLSSRAALPEDFGVHMNDKCIRLDKMCEVLNDAYRTVSLVLASDNRTSLLSSQYAGMARLMLDADKRAADMVSRDTAFEKAVREALIKADVPFSAVVSVSGREKKTRVTGISADRFPFGAAEFQRYMLANTGVHVSEPCFDITEKGDMVLRFERAAVISFDYAEAGNAKESGEANGDTVNFLSGEKQYFHALLCDGMGSGMAAATASRLSSLFFEKMLGAGIKKSVIFELLNNVLLSQSGENFSTVDLFEADKLTGRCLFIKAGAAPTYILRAGKIYKIFSATPPVGILSSFSAESTRFDVCEGDVIVMLSDGVVQNGEDGAWLAELIRVDRQKDPARLAQTILEKAKEINTRTDDMTVAVISVKGLAA